MDLPSSPPPVRIVHAIDARLSLDDLLADAAQELIDHGMLALAEAIETGRARLAERADPTIRSILTLPEALPVDLLIGLRDSEHVGRYLDGIVRATEPDTMGLYTVPEGQHPTLVGLATASGARAYAGHLLALNHLARGARALFGDRP